MLELGVGVELCWPHSPQQKGAVENLVGFVKSSFFKVRCFHDQEDLEQQLVEWHREVNQERPCRATGIIPAVRLAEEAPRLRSLKVRPKDLALRIPVYVGPTGTVLHDGHPYSMPPETISMPATLHLYADRVHIVAGRFEVNHPRKFVAHEGSTLAAHRAAMVAAVSGKRGKRYLKRQQLLELGEPAFLYLTEIVHRRPRQGFYDVDRLHDILQSHGAEVLRRAMEQGLQKQVFSATYIQRFLQPCRYDAWLWLPPQDPAAKPPPNRRPLWLALHYAQAQKPSLRFVPRQPNPQKKEQHQENYHASLPASFSPYCSLIKSTKTV